MQLNQKQELATQAIEPKVIVVSPAGSGKTTVLTQSILKYMQEHPNDKITAITFTRKATAELEERLGKHPNLYIGTIHAWSLARLKVLAMEYGFKVQLLEEEAIKEILKALCSRRKQYYINQFQLYGYVMGNYNIDIDERLKAIYESLRWDYVNFKQKEGLYDFTDLPNYLLDMLQEYEETIAGIDALYVDEFQDVDPIQAKVFDLVMAKKKYYIGDPAQSIYVFRGASSNIIKELSGFVTYDLDTNYRSYQEIIDYAYTVRREALYQLSAGHKFHIGDVQDIEPSSIICSRGKGGQILSMLDFAECVDLYSKDKYSGSKVLKQLIPAQGTQILCRSNKQVKKIQSLGVSNVSTVHQAKGLEYENVILVDFPVGDLEETNIAHVAMTRAKNILVVIDFEVLCNIICVEEITTTDKLF